MGTPEAETETSTAAQLIDALLAGGQPIDEGGFSLDTAAAAAKLDAYQYADRSTYLVAIAEAAAGLGARRVSITTHAEDLLITIAGANVPEPATFLADPFARLRGADHDRTGRALGRLGVGLHMALGHASIERVAVSHASAAGLLVAEYRRNAAAQLVRHEPDGSDELLILIDRPWTEGLSLRGPKHEELEHLRVAVQHSPLVFELDGHTISGRTRPWDCLESGAGPGFRYEVGIDHQAELASVIELWSEGVRVETLPGPGDAFRAIIHLEAPRRDLSQMKIVRDATVDAALAAVDEAHRKLGRTAREPKSQALGPLPALPTFLLGAMLYALGIAGGAFGFGSLTQAPLLSVMLFAFMLVALGSGAYEMAKAVSRDAETAKSRRTIVFVVGVAIAIYFGFFTGIRFV